MLNLDMIREAREALRGIARRTPLDRAQKFGEKVYIKAENLQLTGPSSSGGLTTRSGA